MVGLRRCGRENAPRLLLDAHLDEIGFLITGHEDGYLRFAPLGLSLIHISGYHSLYKTTDLEIWRYLI